jgi:flagellar protein FlaI
MHLRGIGEMGIRQGGRSEALSASSVQWVKTYAMAARGALDEIYSRLLSNSLELETIRSLCQVYEELGAIYDGSLLCNQEHNEFIDLRQIFARLRGSGERPLRDSVRDSLLKSLRGIDREFDLNATSHHEATGPTSGIERESYKIGPLAIRILDSQRHPNPIYEVSFIDHRVGRLIFELAHLAQLKSHMGGEYLDNFQSLIERRKDYASTFIRSLCDGRLSRDMESAVYWHAAYTSVGLRKFYPLLIDDGIDEFYLDAPGNRVYLDHERWNRCLTNIRLSQGDVEHLITHLRRETNQRLDYAVPSIKADLSCDDFNIRTSIDAFPLTRDGTALDVRKFRRVPMTIIDLIANRTLDVEAAAFLLFCLIFRRSMTIVGETSSGKTTLVNAIDVCAPRWWRKITIEDAVESVPQLRYGRHQVRIQVEPLEQGSASRLKSVETTRLLHRNPTYVLLGEIQTSEHSKALFQALASGLRVMHTVHASSPEALLRRFLVQHGVSREDLKSLELIVFIRNFFGFRGRWRRVTRISELTFEENGQSAVTDIFRHDFESDSLAQAFDVAHSATVRRILEDYPLDIQEVEQVLTSFKRFLAQLFTKQGSLCFEEVMGEFDAFNARIAREFHLFEVKNVPRSEVTLPRGEPGGSGMRTSGG